MLLDEDENVVFNSNESNSDFNIDILQKIQSDIRSEWERPDEPGINFFLLLAALLLLVIWVVFISFFFSRMLGLLVGIGFQRFLKWSGVSNISHLSIGSFSISILSGKVMFRNFLLITDDYTFKLNDGWVILSYWKYVPKKSSVQQCMNVSRLHVSLNGVKLHVFNRIAVYQGIAKQTGLSSFFANLINSAATCAPGREAGAPSLSVGKTTKNSEKLEMQLDAWWDKLWRLFGSIRFDISSGRLMAGNHLLPSVFALTFENFQSKILLTDPSNKEEDRYMFRMRATVENVRASLVKSTDYLASKAGAPREDPPRTMGDGFAILQTAMVQFYYHQDLLSIVKDEVQSLTQKTPVWETVWRLDKNTVISYGPWADKQRTLIYSFFFPSDYGCSSVTEMPKKGERRILLSHDVRVSLVRDATIDFWFMRNEELNAIHSRVKQGSSFEFYIPWITTENGFTSNIRGSLLCLEAISSLPFREFIKCETFRFNVTSHYPKAYNHQQTWDFVFELHRFSSHLLWDHKRFVVDLINEWTGGDEVDLCKFIPCTWNFNISVVDKFEIVLLLNEKNWVDTSSSETSENLQAAVVGSQLYMNFALIFTEFGAETTSFELDMKAEDQIAVRIHLPPGNTLEPIFTALTKSTSTKLRMKSSSVFVSVANDETWIEIWRTESICMKCEYEYHASSASKFRSDIPVEWAQKWLPPKCSNPYKLEPDNLFFQVDIGGSEAQLSGLLLKLILELKDNYFGVYDQISDVSKKPLHAANMTAGNIDQLDVDEYRPMNVFFKLQLHNFQAHCLVHKTLVAEENQTDKSRGFCPVVNIDQVLVELKKDHNEALVQVLVGPSKLDFFEPDSSLLDSSNSLGSCSLSSFQFRGHGLYSDIDVPWAVECMEYAWLVEVLTGEIYGKVSPNELVQLIQFLDSFIVLALAVDESMEVPERFNLCHHFQNIRLCPHSDLKIIDNKNRWQSCESSEALKYRLVRVSIDRLDLFVVDEKNCSVQLAVDNARLSFCNAHLGSFAENMIVQLPKVEISQYISVDETRWLKCGAITIEKNCLDMRLPYKPMAYYMPEERRKFILTHDKVSNRLYFLWKKNDKTCACFGDCRFFARQDTSGFNFHSENLSAIAIADIKQDIDDQPAYLQCILTPNSCGIEVANKFVDSTLSVPSSFNSRYSSTELESKEENDNIQRKISEGSFHSATSHRHFSTSQGFNHLETSAFIDFFETYDIYQQNKESASHATYLIKQVSNGITGLKLTRKEDPKKPQKSEQPVNSSQLDLLKTENWAKDPVAFYLRGEVGRKLEMFLSPLCLNIVERFAHLIGNLLQATHPAYLAQKAYHQCSMSQHSQPLTASIIFRRQEKSFSPSSIRISLVVPSVNISLVQCKKLRRIYPAKPSSASPSTAAIKEDVNSIVLLSIAPFCVEVSTTNNPNEERKLSIITQHQLRDKSDLGMFHMEVVQLMEKTSYDNVYYKLPVLASTNWAELTPALGESIKSLRPRVVLDVQIPQFNFVMSIPTAETTKREVSSTNLKRPITNLELSIDALNVTAVLGKSMESQSKSPHLEEEELSFFEVLTPLVNSWIEAGYKVSQQITTTLKAVDEWKDLTFTKLLADVLDWHDDQMLVPERTQLMEKVKLHSQKMNSCPSCKLVLNLLHYIAHNEEVVYKQYPAAVNCCSTELRNKERRKMAIIALLSHWQTLICNEVQIADNILAQKYKYNANKCSSSVPQSSNTDKNNVVWQSFSSTKTGKIVEAAKNITAVADVTNGVLGALKVSQSAGTSITAEKQEEKLGMRNSPTPPPTALATTNTPFQPGHRRGPSTATQMTAGENEPQDLYHRILKAHKEYKEQKEQQQQSSVDPNTSSTEMNPMELMLCVFFWNLYQVFDLEVSILDSIPQRGLAMEYSLQLTEFKLNVVEKKYLVSQRNEMLVALSSHHLVTLENVDLDGEASLVVNMDEYGLRPARANAAVEYSCKVQNMRVVVSLVSVFFINDITQFIRNILRTVNSLVRTSALNKSLIKKEIRRESSWATGVLDKLYDYERCCSAHRQEVLHINVLGNWALKMATFESMITDLFISMTLLKVGFNQKHTRIHSACQTIKNMRISTLIQRPNSTARSHITAAAALPAASQIESRQERPQSSVSGANSRSPCTPSFMHEDGTEQGAENPAATITGLTLDWMTVSLKRASLIVSEHIVNQQRNSDTRQILNCSLRESTLVYERVLDRKYNLAEPNTGSLLRKRLEPMERTYNKLNLVLGELEGDLPMHAESIHEVVLRHGPQINEQLHRIVGQPQPAAFAPSVDSVEPDAKATLYHTVQQQQPPSSQPSTPSTEYVSPSEGEDHPPLPVLEEEPSTTEEALVDDFFEPVLAVANRIEIEFDIQLAGVELNVQLLPSLKAKYKLQKALSSGKSGEISDFFAEISEHQLYFLVTSASSNGALEGSSDLPLDTFTLQLPKTRANGSFNVFSKQSKEDGWNSNELAYRNDGYYNIVISMGSMNHTFSTDLLNQILFAEQSFRSELSFLLDRLSSERPKTAAGGAALLNVNPIFFNLELKGEGVPWLQVTASTPTSTAIRFTIDSPHAVLTNRLAKCSANQEAEKTNKQPSSIDRLFGRAKVQLNVKLGQLYKTALYEETQEELEEYANFMTQISVQNEESVTKDSIHSYLISLNRPLLLIKSNAIDKAILLWLNYRNTYNYWREERNKLLVMSNRVYEKKRKKSTRDLFSKLEQPSMRAQLVSESSNKDIPLAPAASSNFGTDMNINLSLSIQNGLYICMPLYNPEINDSMAALVVSLQKSDVTVCVKKELACLANFTAFKVTFIDNFDEQSLSEPWLAENAAGGESSHSNFFFFPHGSYSFCTSAISPSAQNQNAKWILSVKSHMKGMIIDFDYRIGKLTSLLIHTLSSFASDDEVVEEYAPSDSSFAYTGQPPRQEQKARLSLQSSVDNNHFDQLEDPQHFQPSLGELDENEEFNRVIGHENKIRWLERKMHEQSVLVSDLSSHRPRMSELMIEKERRKLRILELVRFKQFRQSVWDKIRQKVNTRTHYLSGDSSKNGENSAKMQPLTQRQPSRSLLSANSFNTTASSHNNLTPKHVSGSGPSTASKTPNPQQQVSESVDMSIDIQINIECGQCFLRSNQPPTSGVGIRGLLTKKASARDLKSKMGSLGPSLQSVTQLSIPSLDARTFYTSNDVVTTPPLEIRELFQARDKAKATGCAGLKNKCFYFSLELASMPLETLITPCLADFLEQVVEPLPESLFETAKTASETSSNSLPIVAIDTSSLPLDVLFHMSVQSSTIRFEGQQQRSSAADMLLTLPRLTLMASTRKYNEQDWTVAGIYLSATLSSFSLSIYSPHQQSSSHDALSLTLDQFSVTASRTKNPNNSEEDRNKVQLVIVSNVGTANFNYDMRRLSELLTFPKPWYRKQLIRRLFFGEQSVAAARAKMQRYNSSSSNAAPTFKEGQIRYGSDDFSGSNLQFHAQKGSTPVKSVSSAAQTNQITWAASVIFSMQWKELNINAQMSNTMGNTQWLARQGILRGHLKLDSQRHRDVAVSFKLFSSELSAQGGAISGEVSISKLLISARHSKSSEKAPENVASLEFENIECRTEWMSRPIFIGKFAHPQIMITDEWKHVYDTDTGEVSEAMCFVNISGSWSDLQMVITKNTVDDMIKIGEKLIVFFKDQLKNSKMVWGEEFEQRHRCRSSSSDDGSAKNTFLYNEDDKDLEEREDSQHESSSEQFLHHWHSLLDAITDVQLRKKFLPLPRSKDGFTVVGGNVELTANRISLSCMNGEMNASSWAFFHMSEVGVLFTSRSCYTFMDEKKTSLGVQTKQQFIFRLGQQFHSAIPPDISTPVTGQQDFKAVVCRVQHSRGFLLRHGGTSVDHSLQAMIGDVLKQLSASSPNLLGQVELDLDVVSTAASLATSAAKAPPPRFTHNVLQLFQFPSLEAVLSSLQNQDFEQQRKSQPNEGSNGPSEMVHSSFVCDFKGGVGVQTDFNAQVSFLPELLKSYIVSPPDLGAAPDPSGGERRFTPRKSMPTGHSSSLLPSLGTYNSSMHGVASGGALQQPLNDSHFKEPSSSSATTKDPRQYICVKWVVDPKIQFIDRFKWNPPVVDDILKKLQIFDHRRTIPKVMQRGVLDRCDILLAAILEQILNQVKRE